MVFNFGQWFDSNRLGDDWPSEYKRILNKALQMDFGKIPDRHVFFRTTSVRHFLRGQGDWNTESSNKAGASGPDPRAQWVVVRREQPRAAPAELRRNGHHASWPAPHLWSGRAAD